MLIYALLQTIELWIFLGVLALALGVEELIKWGRARNEAKQREINLEVDRLHR
jgi:hypothetical protein